MPLTLKVQLFDIPFISLTYWLFILDIYESSRVKEDIFPWSRARCITWQTFKSPEISSVKLDPWTSTLTVWIDGVGDGEGDPPSGGDGFERGLALGEGEVEVPRTAGDEPDEDSETAEAEGIGDGEGEREGFADAFIEGFEDDFTEGLGFTLGDGLGRATMFSPSTSVF